MTNSREGNDHHHDFGTEEGQEAYKARRAAELKKLREEDEAKEKQARIDKTSEEFRTRLKIDQPESEEEILDGKGDKPLRQDKMF